MQAPAQARAQAGMADPMSFRRALAALLAAALLAFGFAACGDDDSGTTDSTSTEAEPANESEVSEPATDAALDDTSVKPVIETSGGDAPAELQIDDIVEGDGAEAATGDTVSVQYVGVDFETGDEFDASWDRGEPFEFPLGGGFVIEGWDEGVAGMKEGGRRKLTIPSDLAYGEAGAPPAIGPGATLVFVIDLLEVK